MQIPMAEAQPTHSSSHSSPHSASSSPIRSRMKNKRPATVYDAVAGRVSSDGFIPPHPRISKNRDTPASSNVPNPPEEVLFRRRGAPARYEEDDFYWADRNLAPGIELPDSDLLKAVHAYVADFYGRTGGASDFGSLDETALMAVGVLLEEWAEVILGERGHEVFLEGERRTADQEGPDGTKDRDYKTDVERVAQETQERQRPKRRKTKHESDENNTDE